MSNNNPIDLTIKVNDKASGVLKSVSGLFEQTRTLADSLASATQDLDGRFAGVANAAARFVSQTAGVAKTIGDAYSAVKKLNSALFALDVAKARLAVAKSANTAATTAGTAATTAETAAKTAGTVATTAETVATTASTAAMSKQEQVQLRLNAARRLSASGTLTLAKAKKTLSAKTIAVTAMTGLFTKQMKAATAAKWLLAAGAKGVGVAVKFLGTAMKAALGPIGLIIAVVAALIAIGGRLVNFFRRNSRAAREQSERIDELSTTWNKSSKEIRAEMEKYGLTVEEWEAKQSKALDSAADKWGISSEEIKAALEEQNISLADWESQQYEMLRGVAAEWGMSTDEVLAEMAKQGVSAEQWSSQMGQAWDNFQGDVSRNVNNIVNGFREIPTSLDKSSQELRAVLDGNIQATENWRANMEQIADRVPEDMMKWIEAQGPEFSEAIEAMLACDAELEAWKDTLSRATILGTEQALENIEDPAMRNAFIYQLDGIGQAVAENTAIPHGMESLIDQCAEVVKEGGQRVGEEFTKGVEEGLESVDFAPVVDRVDEATDNMAISTARAMNIIKSSTTVAMEHFSSTVKTNMTDAEESVENSLTRIIGMFDSLRTKLPLRLFEVGSNAMVSMKNGMLSKRGSVLDTAHRIARSVVNTIRSAMDMNSPSRVMMRLGEGTMGGFASGMERMQSRVNRVVSDTAGLVKQGLDQALAQSKLSEDMTLTVVPKDSTHHSNLLERLIDAVESGKQIVLDSGELVGATYGSYDAAVGQAVSYNTRWGR